MESKKIEDIIKFLKDNIEPLEDSVYGAGYRASVYLVDGRFLPCVMFRDTKKLVELAMKRFDQEKSGKSIFKSAKDMYLEIVKTFVAKGNCINDYHIAKVEISKSALPISILKQIRGETTMGWSGFAARMKDDRYFGFGTAYSWDFFQMPENYVAADIEEIINHSYVLKNGEIRAHEVPFFTPPTDYNDAVIYRERPYFECYLDNL